MTPGDIWELDDDTRRVVLSNPVYNTSGLNRVITAVVAGPPVGSDPFAVAIDADGTQFVYADRLAMHPRTWLRTHVGAIPHAALAEAREHLRFLLCQ